MNKRNDCIAHPELILLAKKNCLQTSIRGREGTPLEVDYSKPLPELMSEANCEMFYYVGKEKIGLEQLPLPGKNGMEAVRFEVVQFIDWGWAKPSHILVEFLSANLRPANLVELLTFVSAKGMFSSRYHGLHALGSILTIRQTRLFRRTTAEKYCPTVDRGDGKNHLLISNLPSESTDAWKPENLFLGVYN